MTAIGIKAGVILAAVLAIFWFGYRMGVDASKSKAEALHAAQLQAVVNAMDENARQAAADHVHMQGVIDAYHATPIDPIVPGLAHRVYVYAAGACGGGVPQTGSVAPGTQTPAPVTLGPSPIEQALGDYIAACSADAAQMIPMVELAP